MMSGKSQPATKEDLVVVKSDLKSELAAVEKRLDQKITAVFSNVLKTREEMAAKSDLTIMNTKLDHIIGTLDAVSGKIFDHKWN